MKKTGFRLPVGLLCFALPGVLFLAVCAGMAFAPFGERSILIFDLSDQVVEFLCALKHGDVFFSWNAALGGGYIGTFSYYVSSPFSLLTLLCPDECMPVAVVFLVALKLAAAGLTFGLLLRRRTGRWDATTVAFAVCYALMAYNIAYAMSFMWLDGVLWLPVLLIGVEDLLEGKQPWVLLAGLVCSFVSSWYISYMTGIFCALYLLWRCGCGGAPLKRTLAHLGRLAAWAGLALLLTAWLWLPTAASMFAGKLTAQTPALRLAFNWPLTTLLYKLFIPGAYDSVTYTGSAFLYCSLLAPVLAAVWFFLPSSRRSKLSTAVLGGFLLFSLWFYPLDTAWHLFQPPNSFPGRWAFVVSCFLLLVAYDALLALLPRLPSPRLRTLLPGALAVVLAADMGLNAFGVLQALDRELGFESYASYHDYKQILQPLADHVREEGGFVRVDSDLQRSRNEPCAFGYKGLTFFSSAYNDAVNRLLSDLGYEQGWFWSTSLGATPVSDDLLGVGWRISGPQTPDWTGAAPWLDEPALYRLEEQGEGAALYRSGFSGVSPGYLVRGNLDGVDWSGDPFRRQNALMSALTGLEQPCFYPIDARWEEKSGAALLRWTSDGNPVYVLMPAREDGLTNGILQLPSAAAGEEVEVDLTGLYPPLEGLEDPLVYALDEEVLQAHRAVLEGGRLVVTGVGNHWLEGTVRAPAEGTLYTSIPSIPGWTVTVDGEETDTGSFRDTLLTVPLAAGEHTLHFQYTAPGLRAGLALTVLGLAFVGYLVLRGRKRNINLRENQIKIEKDS